MSFHSLSKCLQNVLNQVQRNSYLHAYRLFTGGSDSLGFPSRPKPSDPVVLAIRSAPSSSDILKIAGIHGRHMEPHQVILSLGALQDLQNTRQSGLTDLDVTRSPEFFLLCKTLKKHLRSLEVNDILVALKAVTFFKIHCKSATVQGLLHMLKHDVNSLSLAQITFLSFLLRKYPQDPVVDALKIALPIVFETHIFTKLDRKNVGQLVDTFTYCAKNNVSRKCTDYVANALQELDQLEWLTMDPIRAKSIILALCQLSIDSPQYRTLYQDAASVLSKSLDQLHFNDLDFVLNQTAKAARGIPYMTHQPLLEAANEVAVRKKFSLLECCVLLRKLNSTGVVTRSLLDYVADLILNSPHELRDGKFGTVKSFVGGLSVANYKTEHWNVLKDLIPSANCFQHVRATEPWVLLCIELASLDIFCDSVLSHIFSQSFLEDFLARDYNKLDLLQLLRLHQAVRALNTTYDGPVPPQSILQQAIDMNGRHVKEFPLKAVLEQALGGQDYVLTKCFAAHGHFIDHVVVLRRGGHAVAFPSAKSEEKIILEHLSLPPHSLKVAVRYLSPSFYNGYKQLRGVAALTQKILEAQGFAVVNVSQDSWQETPDWEKSPYLMQSIRLNSRHIYEESESVAE